MLHDGGDLPPPRLPSLTHRSSVWQAAAIGTRLVHVCAGAEQFVDDGAVPVAGGQDKRTLVVAVHAVDVRAWGTREVGAGRQSYRGREASRDAQQGGAENSGHFRVKSPNQLNSGYTWRVWQLSALRVWHIPHLGAIAPR